METVSPEVTSPISKLIPYITASFSALKAAFGIVGRVLRPVRNLSPVPIILYILAPVLFFLDITTTIFLRTPYRTATYLLEAVYPLYVFVGVACITGGILGLAARVLSRVAILSLQDPDTDTSPEPPAIKNEIKEEVLDLKTSEKKRAKSKQGP